MKISSSQYTVLGLCFVCLCNSQPSWAQGLGEFAGINAGVMGLGAGLAARDKGRMLKQGAAFVQESLATQNKAISDCMQLDKQYEMKKDWENAEKCLTIALQYIAKRDGPGSEKSVPVLSRLVKVEEEQDKIEQAIGYQKTVLIFNKAGKVPKPDVTHESLVLSNLYVKNSDFTRAEPVLRESITLEKPKPVKSPDYKKSLRVFGSVLRENKKPEEAAVVESELVAIESAPASEVDKAAAAPPAISSTPAPADLAIPASTPAAASHSSGPVTPGSLPDGIPIPMPGSMPIAPPATSATSETPATPAIPVTSPDVQAVTPAPETSPSTTESAGAIPATSTTPATTPAMPATGETAPQP